MITNQINSGVQWLNYQIVHHCRYGNLQSRFHMSGNNFVNPHPEKAIPFEDRPVNLKSLNFAYQDWMKERGIV